MSLVDIREASKSWVGSRWCWSSFHCTKCGIIWIVGQATVSKLIKVRILKGRRLELECDVSGGLT